MGTVSKSVEMFLEMQRIELIEGDVWGHRKDLNEYYSIPSSVIEKIREMKVEGKSAEDIGVQVSRESKLDPEMVAYILNKEAPA
jgi:S-adenosylmethionine:tRNA-ribosyltransferase-isomerase (queuine synthetase)